MIMWCNDIRTIGKIYMVMKSLIKMIGNKNIDMLTTKIKRTQYIYIILSALFSSSEQYEIWDQFLN